MSKSKSCDCTHEMAEKLERFRNFFADVYEGNQAVLEGTIREVKDDKILHMEQVSKQVFIGDCCTFSNFYEDLYISICDITEFAPLFEETGLTAEQVAARKKQIQEKTNLNETKNLKLLQDCEQTQNKLSEALDQIIKLQTCLNKIR